VLSSESLPRAASERSKQNGAGSVVLVSVDLIAEPVLLPVYQGALARSQVSAIDLAIAANLMVQPGLPAFEPRGLPRCEPARSDALRDAILLILSPLIDSLRTHPEREGGSQNRPDSQSAEPLHCWFLLLTV
jgi:hypothetical protein